jgi:pimeloyl-ACP methyl ester carboxylesterase
MTNATGRNTGFADVNGTRLGYEVAGEGHPLALIHAGIADSRMWDDQWDLFARHYKVIRYDIRGCGKSPMPAAEFAHHDDLYALLQFLGVQKTYLVGVSMGGAIDFTLDHPEMVDALIPVASGVVGRKPSDAMIEAWKKVEEALDAGGIPAANELELRMWVDGPFRTPGQVAPEVRERVREMNANNFAMGNDEAKPRMLDPMAIHRLAEIHAPTLIVAGDLDQPDILESANILEAGIPGARKVVLHGTAHMPSMERPEEFNRIVLEFLSGLSMAQAT